jgi:predicted P-loop ATPase
MTITSMHPQALGVNLYQSEQKSDRVLSPTLWVTDTQAATSLEFFQIATPADNPKELTKSKHHILCFDPDTKEHLFHQKAIALLDAGCRVDVMPLENHLTDFIFGVGRDATPILLTSALPYETWAKGLENSPLRLEQALELAAFWKMSALTKLQISVELEALRKRASMSSYDWNKFIRQIEEEIHAAVDRKTTATTDRAHTRSSRYKQRYQAIKELWDGKIRLNTLKQRVELDGEPLDLDFVRTTLCLELDIDIPKEEAIEIVVAIARNNQYCPIVEYLEQVEATYPNPNIDFDKLTQSLLGTSDRLHAAYLKRHLIGSVARAFNPGCQMDTALILQGDQGIGKSSFFRTLYGAEFFDDTMAEASDKDELMKLHQHWAVEWAEFETQLSRKGYSRLKQFMTTKVDTYRPPYGRTPKAFPRRSILVGSTNELEFLSDPSGDRRYWVIPLAGNINLNLAEQLRDQIWAAAVAAYRAGEQWWLTSDEKQLADEANKFFRISDTWEEFISTYVRSRQFVTVAEVLDKALGIEPSKQDKSAQMRTSAILRRLGWDKGKCWVAGTWKRGWINPDRSTDPPSPEVDRKVDRCQEPHEINVSSHTDPPDPPFEQHFPELSTLNEATQAKQEKSLEKGGSVEPQESSNADEIEVSPTDPPLEQFATQADDDQFEVGDKVFWCECPVGCESLAPFQIMSIDGDYAKLDLFAKLARLAELRRAR